MKKLLVLALCVFLCASLAVTIFAETTDPPEGPGEVPAESVTVYGDVDGDKEINGRDVVAIMRRLTEDGATGQIIDLKAADVNLDGYLDARDVIAVMQYIVGIPTVRLGHRDMIETITPATCKTTGKVRLTCLECSDSKVVEIPVTTHSYEHGVCIYCDARSPDYAVIVYTEYLKANGRFSSDLRGYEVHERMNTSDYTLQSYNICDTNGGKLVLYGFAEIEDKLQCHVQIEIPRVGAAYKVYYDAYYSLPEDGTKTGATWRVLARGEGYVERSLALTFTSFTDPAKEGSHLSLAQSIVNNLVAHTDRLMAASGTGVGVNALGFKLAK